MRYIIITILLLASLTSMAIDVDKNTLLSLEYIRQGYIQYGVERLKNNATTNSLASQFYVAVCYEHGIVIEKNLTNAFRMYRRAAERGLPDAMHRLASFYENGIVVAKDVTKAKEWFQRYIQKGGKLILPNILQIYNEGIKHSENYAQHPNGQNNSHTGSFTQSGKQTINNITIIQQAPNPQNSQPTEEKEPTRPAAGKEFIQNKSDVDINIPVNQQIQKNTFVLIVANENYVEEAKVQNALNDGTVFGHYCHKTLGIPQINIKYISDATLNGIKRNINWLTQVMDAYHGEASVIFYYAGHGIPDESNGSAYLLPVDGVGNDITTGYSLGKLYEDLGSRHAKSIVILLDACFSGAMRDGGMLASARGVAIKAKQNAPKGNMVVLSAAQGDETAYPYKEKGHGMFTYYFLKKLQDTKGNVSLGELGDYVTTEVKKQSIVVNGKMQTPLASPSTNATDWRNWKLR